MTARDYLKAMRALVFILWPLTTWAAGASLGSVMGEISASDWIWLALLSGVSGLAALLYRVRRSFEAEALRALGEQTPETDSNRQLIDWRLFALCHMAGAMFVGVIVFLGCEAVDANTYIEAAVIALASWSGAKLADRLADAQTEGLVNRLGALSGSRPERASEGRRDGP